MAKLTGGLPPGESEGRTVSHIFLLRPFSDANALIPRRDSKTRWEHGEGPFCGKPQVPEEEETVECTN